MRNTVAGDNPLIGEREREREPARARPTGEREAVRPTGERDEARPVGERDLVRRDGVIEGVDAALIGSPGEVAPGKRFGELERDRLVDRTPMVPGAVARPGDPGRERDLDLARATLGTKDGAGEGVKEIGWGAVKVGTVVGTVKRVLVWGVLKVETPLEVGVCADPAGVRRMVRRMRRVGCIRLTRKYILWS